MTGNEIVKNEFNGNELSLLSLVPQVLRARDFRLYTDGGKRLVDLWLNGGSAVLGHTPPSLLREIKNTASRGLYAPFPHFTRQRFLKALSQLLPGMVYRIFAAPPNELCLPNDKMSPNAKPVLWRPFLDFCLPPSAQKSAPEKQPTASVQQNSPVIPVLPGIQGWRNGLPVGLCVCAAPSACEDTAFSKLPAGDFLPPVLLAAAARGIWDLIAANPQRANIQWQHINKIIKTSPWKRRGIYLFPQNKPSPETWALLFRNFLDAGFLLPPVPDHPLILPGILSPGEEAKLAEVLSQAFPDIPG